MTLVVLIIWLAAKSIAQIFVWIRIPDEGSLPGMRIWSILSILSDFEMLYPSKQTSLVIKICVCNWHCPFGIDTYKKPLIFSPPERPNPWLSGSRIYVLILPDIGPNTQMCFPHSDVRGTSAIDLRAGMGRKRKHAKFLSRVIHATRKLVSQSTNLIMMKRGKNVVNLKYK